MVSIQVEHWFPASRSLVFEHVSDHERFLAAPGLTCRVVTPGEGQRDGLGAIREVRTGGMRFRETITAFDPVQRYDYHIDGLWLLGVRLALRHEGGSLEFADLANGTRVRWKSTLAIDTRVIGGFLERDFQARATHAFASLLRQASQRLAG